MCIFAILRSRCSQRARGYEAKRIAPKGQSLIALQPSANAVRGPSALSESRTCSMVRSIFDCDHAVPSRALGSVKRVVGKAVERPERPVGQSLRYADTHSNLQVGGDGVERAFRQFASHSLTQAAEIRPRDPAYTEHEFLAAQPPRMAIMRGFEGLQLVCQQD